MTEIGKRATRTKRQGSGLHTRGKRGLGLLGPLQLGKKQPSSGSIPNAISRRAARHLSLSILATPRMVKTWLGAAMVRQRERLAGFEPRRADRYR
jgi:hypothetical protein